MSNRLMHGIGAFFSTLSEFPVLILLDLPHPQKDRYSDVPYVFVFRYEDRRILLQKAVAWHLQQEDFRRELRKELAMRGR